MFSRPAFKFDSERLYPFVRGHAEDEQASPQRWSIGYFESIPRCPKCPLKRQCRPSMPARWIVRDVKEAARDIARYKMQT
jgi:hypothetical protein